MPTPASLTTGHSTANTTRDTASIAPSSNALVLLWVKAVDPTFSATPAFSSITGNGLTWVEVATLSPATGVRYSLYRAMGASPSSGAITIQTSVSAVAIWSVIEATDVDTGGSNGADAVVQVVTNADASNTSVSATLAAFASANNRPFAFGEADTTALGEDGWTEINEYTTDYGIPVDNVVNALWLDASNDLTATVTRGTTGTMAIFAIEVAAAPPYTEVRTTVSGDDVLILVPTTTPKTQAIIFCHGFSNDPMNTDSHEFILSTYWLRFAERFTTDGYYVASSFMDGDSWGNDAALAAVDALVSYMDTTYGVEAVVMLGDSMGGVPAQLVTLQGTVPGVRGFLGFDPVCDLFDIYDAPPFLEVADAIDTAYDIPGGGSYATQTDGHDPILYATSAFAGKRFRYYASTTDATVTKADHSDAIAAVMSGFALEGAVVSRAADHGDFTAIDIDDVMAFIDRCFSTFPFVMGTAALTQLTSANPGTVSMPSGILAGELLIAICAGDTNGSMAQSGGSDWTLVAGPTNNGTAVCGAVFAKVAAGSDTLSVTFEANDFAAVCFRVQNHGVTVPSTHITVGTPATGSDAAPNPPNCNPGVSKDYLWIEGFAADDDDNATDYETSGWTKVGQAESAQSTSSCMAAAAALQATAASQDPGVMAMAAVEEWVAFTLGIPPFVAASGGALPPRRSSRSAAMQAIYTR